MYYYNSKFLDLLSLKSNKKYSKKFIFENLILKKSFYSKKYKIENYHWILDNKVINLLIELDLFNKKENKSYYKLFYHDKGNWRRCLKYGFNKDKINQIIDSFSNYGNEITKIKYYQFNNVKSIII